MVKIEEPEVKELEKVTYHPMIKHQAKHIPEVMRIEMDDEFTRIDFIVFATSPAFNWEWVSILPTTFIRIAGLKEKLTLVKAVNIAVSPSRHYFKKRTDLLPYTLYFPALPKSTTTIDIIESESAGPTWFNFYGVSMERVRSENLIIGN